MVLLKSVVMGYLCCMLTCFVIHENKLNHLNFHKEKNVFDTYIDY